MRGIAAVGIVAVLSAFHQLALCAQLFSTTLPALTAPVST